MKPVLHSRSVRAVWLRRFVAILIDLKDMIGCSRRVCVWLLAVVGVVLLLVLTIVHPQWHWLRDAGISLSAGATLLVFLAALVCEYVDSSLGMGYGTALTPILLFAGFEPLQIVPAVLISECVTGFVASLFHHRDGNVDLRRDHRARTTAVRLGTLSGFGAVAAVGITVHISRFYLTLVIGTIITAMGLLILLTLRRPFRYRTMHLLAVGALAAFNKGLSGGGYGPLVTAGQVVSGISSRQAVGITSLAEATTCFIGLVAYVLFHEHLDWALTGPLTLGALFSVPVATLTVRRLPEGVLRGTIGGLTLGLGVLTLIRLLAR